MPHDKFRILPGRVNLFFYFLAFMARSISHFKFLISPASEATNAVPYVTSLKMLRDLEQ